MISHKTILFVGVTIALSASTSAFAFQGNPSLSTGKHTSNLVFVGTKTNKEGSIEFVSKLAQSGISILENKDISKEKREENFRKLLHDNFDMKTIARFSLGRYWKVSSKAEKKEYLKLFEDMIISVYSKRFSEYNGQNVVVGKAMANGDHDTLVSSSIVPKSGPKIDVDWRVRKKKNGKFKVIDIIVEGVSMSLTQRSDFASVIQRGGGKVEVLLEHLRKKS
ncbi:MAG: MlaC/ttg2D family ABC transporter substrate-binding protein [Alphaproteobacteria bacterium]